MSIDFSVLEPYLQAYIEKKRLPGVSLCIRGPEGQGYEACFGYCDADHTRPVRPDTIFGIASMSKSICCLCAALLEQEGKLSFDDPVARYFPKFRVPGTPREAVLVRHLCNHTTGIPPLPILEWSLSLNQPPIETNRAYCDKIKAQAQNEMSTIEQMIDYISESGAYRSLGAPGEQMSYLNEGFAILSYIVDQAAGQPMEDYARTHIFEPLGMTRTTFDTDEAKAMGNITDLFYTHDGKLLTTDQWSYAPPYRGYGAVKSTAQDMAAYYQALSCGGKLSGRQAIPAGAADALAGPAFGATREGVYCYGLNKRLFHGAVICEHSGGLRGVSSKGGFLQGQGYSFVALCNQGGKDVDPLLFACYNLVLGLPLDTPHSPYTPCGRLPAEPWMVEGRFRCVEEGDAVFTVYQEHGAMKANREGAVYDLNYCEGTVYRTSNEETPLDEGSTVRFLVRDGRAWAVRVGSRIYQRIED